MISVTVAAHGGRKRCVGAHLRAYGSGRLSICELDNDPQHYKKSSHRAQLFRIFSKLFEAMVVALRLCFSFLFRRKDSLQIAYTKMPNRKISSYNCKSAMQRMPDRVLHRIFSNLDVKSVIACETVCKKWKKTIDTHRNELPKLKIDQLRILFDEGEVILYPSDEKKTPTRYAMPSLKSLALRLRHLNVDSLLVRGMIPVESVPVFRALCNFSLRSKQIYFIWCKFSQDSIHLLRDLLMYNRSTLTDFGLEDCSPTNLLTDDLVESVVSNLSSLRVWNDGRNGLHGITNKTIAQITEAVLSGGSIETLDLSSCLVTHEAIANLILAWVSSSKTDVSISITHSPSLDKDALVHLLEENGVRMRNGCITNAKRCLNFVCY